MKLSLSSGIFPGLFTTEKLLSAAASGVTTLELLLTPGRFNYHNRQYLDDINVILKQHGITISTVHLPFGANLDISAPESAANGIAETGKAIDAAIFFQAETLVIHASRTVIPADHCERRHCSLNSLKQILKLLPEQGITLALENLPPGYLCADATELQNYFAELNDPRLGFCLDTGHANISGELDLLLDHCGNRLANIHAHDNFGAGDSHLIPGLGNIDWTHLSKRLKLLEYNGPLTYEVLDLDDNIRQVFLKSLYSGHAKLY